MERYVEIWWSGTEYHVDIRWCSNHEQHESDTVSTLEEVNEITKKFFTTTGETK